MPRFYETVEFRRLHRQWTRKLATSGFRDIERADGELSNTGTDPPDGAADMELGYDLVSRAHDALINEMVWVGLTKRHRRFWALLLLGLPEKTAGVLAHGIRGGRGELTTRTWRREILSRIEAR